MVESTIGLSILGAMPPCLAEIVEGGYFSIARIITMLVLLVPWLYLAPKVSKDALRLRLPQTLWAGLAMGSGALGVLIWLVTPYFAVGLIVYLVLVSAAMLSYLTYRNRHVPREQRIGPDSLTSFFQSTKKIPIAPPVTKVKIYDHNSRIVAPSPSWSNTDVQAYNLLQTFLYQVLSRRASEADVSPDGENARVRLVIDGTILDGPPMELAQSEAMIQFLKPLGGMNAQDHRRPQKGTMSVDLAQGATEVVLATAGSTGGQQLQLRVRQEIIQTRLGELGMSDEVLASVRELCKQPGLILVSGRSGSGLTSTLYSLLREHDSYTQQIVTLEKAPAVEMENVTQNRYESDDQLASALTSALRRDPDVILLDSCPDSKTAEVILEASSRKAVTLGVPASESFVALAKWVKLCGQSQSAMQNLRAVLCQILVRKLCPACREKYRPDPQILAKANIPADKVDGFYRTPTRPRVDERGNPVTCQTCQNTGYYGRTGVFELLEVTDEIRQMVSQGATLSAIKSACRKNRMLYLQEQALAKVITGVTSIQEVIRVSQESQAKK
jgi:type II secretory ATPase GspE/PulE/Tfp pilus assembly ATPase PilB-like protein